MSFRAYRALSIGIAATVLCAPPALAGVRSAGQTIAYEIVMADHITVQLPSNLPPDIRARAMANVAAAGKKPTTYHLTLVTDRVDADGNAHFNASYSNSAEPASPVFAQADKFQGTLRADGRVMPAYDPSIQLTFDAHGQSKPEEIQNQRAQSFVGLLADFNAFAAGCARHAHFKAGDTWRVDVQDSYGATRTFDFVAKGSETVGGRETALVAITSDSESPYSSLKISGSGHYDGADQLVVDLHEDTTYSSTAPNGGGSSGTGARDFTLGQ